MRVSTFTSVLATGLFAFAGSLRSQDAAAEAKPAAAAGKPETLTERAGYSYGIVIGTQLKDTGIDIDIDQFARALADVYEGKEQALTEDEQRDAFNEAREMASSKQAEAGTKWLEANGKKEGVKTTESGLQYQVLEKGDGESPKATDSVTVHYKGTLTDGTEFDSSYSRNMPASFPLNGVIKGWTEGVQLMKPGAKFRFFIPYDLAYGEQGSPPKIPPYSTLIFDIELIKVGQ